MNTGYFNDAQKEYVITDLLAPKRPWYNFIWNDKFISDFDQFGFGLSLVRDKNDKLREFTAKGDNRHVFIRDNITGEGYSANRNYNNLPFTIHETHVGMGYTKIISEYNGLLFEMTIFVPREGTLECWEVKLTNKTDKKKSLSVYPYAHFFSTITYYIGYVKGDYCDALNGVLVSEEGMNMPSDYIYEFLASEEKPIAFEASDRYFLGVYGNLTNPQGLKNEKLLNRGSCFDFDNGVALQFDLELNANEEKTYRFGMGAANSIEDATRHKALLTEEVFAKNLEYQKQQADMYNDKICVSTGDEEIDRRVNIWLKRQLELGKTWTRLWFRGSRDMMQDISAFVAMDTADAREKIVHSMQFIMPNGNYIRGWMPITLTDARDCSSWMLSTVIQYIKETNDYTILDEVCPYYESDETGTVLDHMFRAASFLQDGVGEKGFTLWGGSDWNDSIDACGILGKGESLWLAEATVKFCGEFVELLNRLGKNKEANVIQNKIDVMKNAILTHGWDKDHFIYGFNDYGERVGSYDSEQGQMYLNPQTWAILADIVTGEEAEKLMEFVENNLQCEYGYIQQLPSYSKGDPHVGRMTYFQKGCYENGSVYNHGCAFKLVADCRLGNGNAALKTFKKMMPDNPDNHYDHSGVEPYAFTNMFLGPENEFRAGETVQHWVTGTCGWLFKGVVEYMLGVQADYDGLAIRPVLPDEWTDVSVHRVFRNATYEIRILNRNPKGNAVITVDGKAIDGDILPDFNDGKIHNVCVEIV